MGTTVRALFVVKVKQCFRWAVPTSFSLSQPVIDSQCVAFCSRPEPLNLAASKVGYAVRPAACSQGGTDQGTSATVVLLRLLLLLQSPFPTIAAFINNQANLTNGKPLQTLSL